MLRLEGAKESRLENSASEYSIHPIISVDNCISFFSWIFFHFFSFSMRFSFTDRFYEISGVFVVFVFVSVT